MIFVKEPSSNPMTLLNMLVKEVRADLINHGYILR